MNWEIGPLGQFCEMYQPKTIATKELIDDGEFPVYGATGKIGFYDKYNHDETEVVVSCRGNCGTVNTISGPSWITGNAMVVRPLRNCMSKEFLNYLLQSLDYRQVITGTAQQQITRSTLTRISVIVPPLDEQEKIVEILEEQFSRLDAALASVRAVREKSERFRRSLLRSVLHTDEPDASGKVKLFPLNECAELSLGIMLDRAKSSGRYLTPYMGNINVRWGEFNQSEMKLMDIKPEQRERSLVRRGDVVVCEGGEPGRTAVWRNDQPVSIQKALHRVRPLEHMDSFFIAYCLELEFRGVSEHELFTGTTIKHLPKEKIKKVMIPAMSLSKQRETVQFLDEQFSRLGASVSIANAIEQKASALRRSLLHSAFSGELTKEWREGAHV